MSEQPTGGGETSPVSTSTSQQQPSTSNEQTTSSLETPTNQSQSEPGRVSDETKTTVKNPYESVLDIYKKQAQEKSKQLEEQARLAHHTSTLDPAKQSYLPPQQQFQTPQYRAEQLPQQLERVQFQQPIQQQEVMHDWSYGPQINSDGTLSDMPNPGHPMYEKALEWSLSHPEQYAQYVREMSKQATRQELLAMQEYQQQQNYLREQELYEQHLQEQYTNTLSDILKKDYHSGIVEDPRAFEVFDSLTREVIDILPKDEQGQCWNIETNKPYNMDEITGIAFSRLTELYDLFSPIMEARKGLNQQVPATQISSTGNLAAPLNTSNDIDTQILLLQQQGKFDEATNLRFKALFGK